MANEENRYSKYVDLVEILELEDNGYTEIIDIKAQLAAVLSLLGVTPTPGSLSHADLADLLSDDHTQYILGDRAQYAALLANVPTIPVGADGLLTGGQVVWTGLLNFLVSAATYRLLGVDYASVQTALTLGAADATNPRIDVIAVDSNGDAIVIAGTPAASPSIPSIDPETQIALSFILVNALATTPANVTNTDIYLENAEWTSSQVGTHHTLASTSNPFAGTKDIEATAAVANDEVKLTKPAAGTTDLTAFNNLIFYLRFKAVWPGAKSLVLSWLNGSTQIGNAVTVKGGTFNLDGANITTYQQVVIPLSAFNALTPVTTLRIRVTGGGAAIGYYLDNISIQAGVLTQTIPGNIMINRGAYIATTSYAVDDVVTNNGNMYIAVASSVGVTPGTDATKWKILAVVPDCIEFVIDGGGDVIETGVKGYLEIPFACQITRATVLLDVSGSIVIDVWKDTYANYPPVDADSITASAPPTVSSALKSQDSTLTGWTTSIAAGDVLGFNVDSVTNATKATLSLRVNRL